jgi:peptide/nickel transport system ATP-binding protein
MTVKVDLREVLRVEDLSVRVQGPHGYDIVTGLDLILRRGEVFGLVGESGSGKTTLALALLGYARPGTEIAGSVRIDGIDMIAAGENARRRARRTVVSYVPQDPSTSLNPAMRLRAQLVETMPAADRGPAGRVRSRRGRGLPPRVAELLTKVRLPSTDEFLRRYPHQLSGGQLQRISIAMAMLNRPKLIVFDEPTTGLDVSTQSHVLDTIREVIAGEETSAVYVTHDLTVIGEIADRVGVMYSGLLVEMATTEDVLNHPAHPYSRRLVLATPSVRERRELVGIAGTPLSPQERGAGCPFAPRCEMTEPACLSEPPVVVAVAPGHSTRCRRATTVSISTAPRRSGADGVWLQPVAESTPHGLLVADSVNAFYGRDQVLHDVALTVRSGDCAALVGESGSGKTTLARCISGLHPEAVEGNLLFVNREIGWSARERTVEVRREIQYIFQNPHASLNPRHTVGRSIAAPLVTFKLAGSAAARAARVRELLDRVALPADYENRYPSQLSGGERQRVAIARALAAEPRLLVCDEITSSLDVSIQASILQLLGELRRDSALTMLFITHHLGLVRAVADQIVILNGGRVVEQGAASAVLDSPCDPYTIELLANTPSPVLLDAAG